MVKRYRRCYQLRVSSFKRKLNSSDRECLLRPLMSRERNTIQETSWISKVKKIVFSGNIFFRRSREVHSSWKFFWSIIILIVSRTFQQFTWEIDTSSMINLIEIGIWKEKLSQLQRGKIWKIIVDRILRGMKFYPIISSPVLRNIFLNVNEFFFFFFPPFPSNACRNFKNRETCLFHGGKNWWNVDFFFLEKIRQIFGKMNFHKIYHHSSKTVSLHSFSCVE